LVVTHHPGPSRDARDSRIVNESAADPVPPWHLWYILVLLALCHLQKLPFSDWVGGMAIASAIRAGVQIDTGLWLIVLTTANSDKQNLSHENEKDSEVRGVNHIRVQNTVKQRNCQNIDWIVREPIKSHKKRNLRWMHNTHRIFKQTVCCRLSY
jgi:hypothetical protein